ncbi:MAG: PIN domain-containing protein [Prochlorotrichaceae cyanobacterium]|jgi:predicted nucleic-acid-binding protein
MVICELVWVLRGRTYSFDKDEVTNVLDAMLHSAAFEFENRSTINHALQQYQQGKADFADYLIGVRSRQAGCTEVISFDIKLKGSKGFRCLS